MTRNMKRRQRHIEHGNQDRWLLTYADLITLLLGLFVILYAMSKIDTKKYNDWITAFEGMFGQSQAKMEQGIGNKGLIEGLSEQMRIQQMLQSALGTNDRISISLDERGVTIHIQEELLFPSGQAELKGSSFVMLDSMANVVNRLPNDIRVEGHTDNMPINTVRFPSNWHLSVARAMNTGYYLIQHHQVNPDKISVVGYGEYRPIALNKTAEGRALNRRVDIVILTSPLMQAINLQKRPEIVGKGE